MVLGTIQSTQIVKVVVFACSSLYAADISFSLSTPNMGEEGRSISVLPLHGLLEKSSEWRWTPACEAVFTRTKEVFASETVLVYYDPRLHDCHFGNFLKASQVRQTCSMWHSYNNYLGVHQNWQLKPKGIGCIPECICMWGMDGTVTSQGKKWCHATGRKENFLFNGGHYMEHPSCCTAQIARVFAELHRGHLRIVRGKTLARSFMWWPIL